ncbi:hypothetical protein EOM39_03275 [Candidatus Gracilibacteria bacterium]|nr:hypothetical protein [Candidatus Gracilibacteria bacterium]
MKTYTINVDVSGSGLTCKISLSHISPDVMEDSTIEDIVYSGLTSIFAHRSVIKTSDEATKYFVDIYKKGHSSCIRAYNNKDLSFFEGMAKIVNDFKSVAESQYKIKVDISSKIIS